MSDIQTADHDGNGTDTAEEMCRKVRWSTATSKKRERAREGEMARERKREGHQKSETYWTVSYSHH